MEQLEFKDKANEELKKDFQLDGTPEERAKLKEVIKEFLHNTKGDIEERESIYKKRRDFFEGRHNLYSNIVGLRQKERQGHILAVNNYIWRFSQRIVQALTNSPMRFKMVPIDEANEIETIRAEGEEQWINKVFKDNNFNDIIFKRNSTIQVRDGDFALKIVVETDRYNEKQIKIYWVENMEKLSVMWDDAAGTGYSFVVYKDLWTLDKIAREFNGYKAEPVNLDVQSRADESSHTDQYGVMGGSLVSQKKTPSGKTALPKAYVSDGWGWLRVKNDKTGESEWKMCNVVMINEDIVQYVKTNYDFNPYILGHSFDNPGSPWSIAFADNLIDPQVELNDRQSDEGDMIRIGSNQKYVVVNMPGFDTSSIRPGSGQAIFIEGENADFRPLEVNVNPFPSETYLTRVQDHLFNLGIPKIAISAGTAPYTGRIGVIQYQAVSDLVDELRMKWTPVLSEVIKRIQDYTNKFFKEETKGFMMSFDEELGQDFGPVMREVEFEWDSILPMSRSDQIVDASTLYDRDVLPVKVYLEMAGFPDPMRIIKELKKEMKDPDMVALRSRFKSLSKGVVTAQIEAKKRMMEAEEQTAESASVMAQAMQGGGEGTPASSKPILHNYQNQERRGVPQAAGVSGVGQMASAQGAANQVAQNIRAQQGG